MTIYKLMESIKRLISYPFRLLISPLMVLIGVFSTNWTSEEDREFFIKVMKDTFKPI